MIYVIAICSLDVWGAPVECGGAPACGQGSGPYRALHHVLSTIGAAKRELLQHVFRPTSVLLSLGTINVCVRFHGNTSHRCSRLSLRNKNCQPRRGVRGQVRRSFKSSAYSVQQPDCWIHVSWKIHPSRFLRYAVGAEGIEPIRVLLKKNWQLWTWFRCDDQEISIAATASVK